MSSRLSEENSDLKAAVAVLRAMIKVDGKQLLEMYSALAACAYWAANGLHITAIGNPINMFNMLENILKESKEYAESEPGRDSNVMYDGFEYSYTPVGGFPESEKEMM